MHFQKYDVISYTLDFKNNSYINFTLGLKQKYACFLSPDRHQKMVPTLANLPFFSFFFTKITQKHGFHICLTIFCAKSLLAKKKKTKTKEEKKRPTDPYFVFGHVTGNKHSCFRPYGSTCQRYPSLGLVACILSSSFWSSCL